MNRYKCSGSVDVIMTAARATDAVAVIRLMNTGRVVFGTVPAIREAAAGGKNGTGYLSIIRVEGGSRPVGMVGYASSGSKIPILTATLILDRDATDAAAAVFAGYVTDALMSAVRKTYGRGALACEVGVDDMETAQSLKKCGWSATGTVRDGYRRFLVMANTKNEAENGSEEEATEENESEAGLLHLGQLDDDPEE